MTFFKLLFALHLSALSLIIMKDRREHEQSFIITAWKCEILSISRAQDSSLEEFFSFLFFFFLKIVSNSSSKTGTDSREYISRAYVPSRECLNYICITLFNLPKLHLLFINLRLTYTYSHGTKSYRWRSRNHRSITYFRIPPSPIITQKSTVDGGYVIHKPDHGIILFLGEEPRRGCVYDEFDGNVLDNIRHVIYCTARIGVKSAQSSCGLANDYKLHICCYRLWEISEFDQVRARGFWLAHLQYLCRRSKGRLAPEQDAVSCCYQLHEMGERDWRRDTVPMPKVKEISWDTGGILWLRRERDGMYWHGNKRASRSERRPTVSSRCW